MAAERVATEHGRIQQLNAAAPYSHPASRDAAAIAGARKDRIVEAHRALVERAGATAQRAQKHRRTAPWTARLLLGLHPASRRVTDAERAAREARAAVEASNDDMGVQLANADTWARGEALRRERAHAAWRNGPEGTASAGRIRLLDAVARAVADGDGAMTLLAACDLDAAVMEAQRRARADARPRVPTNAPGDATTPSIR